MPFDNTNFAERYLTSDPTASAFESFVPGPEGARRLARALRRPLPIEWDFRFHYYIGPFNYDLVGKQMPDQGCGTAGCALGLAYHLGFTKGTSTAHLCEAIGNIDSNIFLNSDYHGVYRMEDVTPTMVADAIDKWLVSIGERTSQE